MNTGILGGSFNPIHIGHLALANYLCEYADLDELWFLVSPRNPLKEEVKQLDAALRLELVRLAIADYPKFQACDIEFTLPAPHYTVHTLDCLKQRYPDRTFHLIIGSDNWNIFPQWYDSQRLLAENRLMVYPRPHYPLPDRTQLPEQSPHSEQSPRSGQSPRPEHVRFVADAPTFDISSTFIRRALRDGKDVRYFLHPAVYARLTAQ
jgi:nicotinate-nucleotide adenylyltransferase